MKAPPNTASTKTDDATVFRPMRLVIRDIQGGTAVLAEDAEGHARGTILPAKVRPLLEEFLPTSGDRFLRLWKTYEDERGGECFFWDLHRLAAAIASAPELTALRKLSSFESANQVFHHASQAFLMARANGLFPGRVSFDAAPPGRKRGDFLITGQPSRRFEVKTINRIFCIEMVDGGTRISGSDVEFLLNALRKKAEDGISQVTPAGTVVIFVWCAAAGAIVASALAPWQCRFDAVFDPAHVVLATRDQEGGDQWFRWPTDRWERELDSIFERVSAVCERVNSVALSGPFVSVVRGSGWMDIGQVVKISDLRTRPTKGVGSGGSAG